MKYGKGIAVLLCAALLAGTLAGCGRKGSENGETGTGMEPVKGRYVETEEALPKQLEEWTVKQLFMEEGKPHLVAVRKEEGKLVFQEWAQTEEGFADVTADWMAGLALPVSGEWTEVRLLVPGEGKRCLYAGYAEEGEDDFKAHLWTEENGEAKEITPEKWKTLDEELGVYEMLTGIVALENGTLAAISFTSAYILDGQDGTVLESGEITAQYDNVLSDGENVWLYATYSAGAGLTFERWREGRTDDAVSVTFSEGDGQMRFCPMKDGTLFLAGEEGIFRGTGSAESGDGISWQKLLAGVETDFSLSDRWCTEIAAGEDGTIYALFQKSGGGSLLKKYEYDPEAVIEITEELKLYSVYESNLLNQAAAMYHREHPEVMITIEYEYPRYYYDETDYSAVYQKLNTMLMGEEAPDILVMDHLDMDSYAEKGLLEDINDVVGPMEENGELLSNITSAYLQEDGRRYVVPLEFAFNMAVGRDITAADMASVEVLAAFLSGQNVSYMGPLTVSELVDRFYPYFCNEIVDGKQLDRETLGRYLEALKTIGDNCGILDTRDKDERAYNMWELASEAKLAFEEVEGFNNAMFPLAIMDFIQGEFAAFENCFIPMVQTGICTKSGYKDRAKDFLEYLLSESVQQTDAYGGFPVNTAALEQSARRDRSEAEAETEIVADGAAVEFRIEAYSQETADKLTAVCAGLEKSAGEDEKIREVLTEVMEGYLKGGQSLEDTLQKAEDGLKMYLAE